jgi:CubicO group peptidase (beta-lactamase class C family)
VSGQTYSDFLKENFFIPLGMKNTYVFTENKPIIPNRAYGYKQIDNKYFCDDYYVLTTGDGGIYSCVDDLSLWVQAFDNENIFTKKTRETIFSTEKLNDGAPGIYAFGWFTLDKNDKKIVFHSGQLGGFTNLMIKSPDDNFSIIILTNYYRDSLQKIFKAVHDCAIETQGEYCTDRV